MGGGPYRQVEPGPEAGPPPPDELAESDVDVVLFAILSAVFVGVVLDAGMLFMARTGLGGPLLDALYFRVSRYDGW